VFVGSSGTSWDSGTSKANAQEVSVEERWSSKSTIEDGTRTAAKVRRNSPESNLVLVRTRNGAKGQDLTHALHNGDFLDHLMAAADRLKLTAVRS
jgi:hypothetical protein